MELTLKQKVIVSSVVIATAFAVGRYSVPEKIKVETKVVEVEKKTDVSNQVTNEKKKRSTHIVIVTKADGEQQKTIDINYDESKGDKKSTTIVDDSDKTVDSSSETVKGDSKVTVSGLVGLNVLNPSQGPLYGAAITKPVIGPVTVGIWGLSNASFGASVGLTF